MSLPCQCPSSADLRDLLEGNTSSGDNAAVVAHLDRCSSCQQSLEALANGDSSFAVTLLDQASYKSPEAGSAYWRAVKHAEHAVTSDHPLARKQAAPVSLAFLDPPEDGSHLGSLANFSVIAVIGQGGMGIVLHAVDTCLQRDVAIKVIAPELSKDEQAVARFCREARAAASINHENVVAVHQVEHDEVKDIPFLVMEFITGESLEQKLQRDGRLSLREIVSIGMQTAAGLAAAHEKGLIHRDIKPGNILLEKSGQRVKLTDFGLARIAEDIRLTHSGVVAGTPLYMSPEQAKGEEVDARSDLFSLGVVLYELASGEPPFYGKTPLAVMKRVTEESPVPLRVRNPELPEWFAQIVDRLLAKNPAERFQSAHEVANIFEHFWVLLKSAETPICPKKKPAHPWKAIIVGAGAGLLTLVLGAVFMALFWSQRQRADDHIPAPMHVLKGNAGPIWSLAVSGDGKSLAMGNDDGTVKFWDISAEKVMWTLNAHKGPVWALALSPDGQFLATGSDDGQALVWEVKTQKEKHVLISDGGVRAMAFDPQGKRLAIGDRKGSVKIWDVITGEKLAETTGHAGLVATVAFAPDGRTVASAGSDKTIKIWNAATGLPMLTLAGHESGVYGIAFSPVGRYLASGSWDRTVRLWDLDSGSQLAKMEGHTQDIWSVTFNSQGTLFASAGEDQMVRIWSVETKKEVRAFRGSAGAILHVRFFSDSNYIVAGGKDGIARVWNLKSF